MSIRRARTAPAVQALLYLAVLMTLAGALGLHREPDVATGSLSTGEAAWARGEAREASSDCPMCLSHRTVALAGLSGLVLEPGTHRASPTQLQTLPQSLSSPRSHQGRAPPAA
ncbi:MAG TPA: hypothetical protein VGG65_09355 [Thermoanaerobaculia bacterium]